MLIEKAKLFDSSFELSSEEWEERFESIFLTTSPRFMFHYSPASNRNSIQSFGLLTNPPQGRIYSMQKAGVFMFADPFRAWVWQYEINRDKADHDKTTSKDNYLEGDIWLVDTEGLDLNCDIFFNHVAVSRETIGIDRITKIPEETIKSLKRMFTIYSDSIMDFVDKYIDVDLNSINIDTQDRENVDNIFLTFIEQNLL